MKDVSSDGRDYKKRSDWTRPDWRRITVRNLRLCSNPECGLWIKKKLLEKFGGKCAKCMREEEAAKAAAKE